MSNIWANLNRLQFAGNRFDKKNECATIASPRASSPKPPSQTVYRISFAPTFMIHRSIYHYIFLKFYENFFVFSKLLFFSYADYWAVKCFKWFN